MAAYPLAAGAFTVAAGGRSADLFGSRELYRFDPSWFGHEIFRSGPVAVVTVAAVLAGAFLIRERVARVTTGTLVLFTGISLIPGFTHLAFRVVGLGPTLWRVSWAATIAALVGVLATRLLTDDPRRLVRTGDPWSSSWCSACSACRSGPAATAWVELPLHWQRGRTASRPRTSRSRGPVRSGRILGPDDLSITIDVTTTRVKTVAPRDYFMDYLRDNPRFHYDERLTLVHFANGQLRGRWKGVVAQALRRIRVDSSACPSPLNPRTSQSRTRRGARVSCAPWGSGKSHRVHALHLSRPLTYILGRS